MIVSLFYCKGNEFTTYVSFADLPWFRPFLPLSFYGVVFLLPFCCIIFLYVVLFYFSSLCHSVAFAASPVARLSFA